jgi:O-antigen ligase
MRTTLPVQPEILKQQDRPDWQWRLLRLGTGPIRWIHWAGILFVVAGSFYLGYLAGFYGSVASRPVMFTLFALAALFVFKYPFLGVVALIASLPLNELVPEVPLIGTTFTLIGGLTLLSYLLQKLFDRDDRRLFRTHPSLIFGALFCIWVLVTNPSAAVLTTAERVWIFTFVQLLALAWLSSQLLQKPGHHQILMLVYIAALTISAFDAISEGVSGQILNEVRPDGFFGSSNDAAREFAIGVVIILYLVEISRNRYINLALFGAMGVLVVAEIYTLSRTGLVLLFLGLGLVLLKWLISRQASVKRQRQLIAALVLSLTPLYFIPDDVFAQIQMRILPSVRADYDSLGIRGTLWQVGTEIWLDNPITGIGVGNYPLVAPEYAATRLRVNLEALNAHNVYIQLLAETGTIGFLLYVGVLVLTVRELWRALRDPNPQVASLAWTWFIVVIMILVGALTKQETYDKMLWMVVGISISLISHRQQQPTAAVMLPQTVTRNG